MLITVKVHSAFTKFFPKLNLSVDIVKYIDLVNYLDALHPKFTTYVRQQASNEYAEGFVFLDKNLNEISLDEFNIKRPKEGDVIYLVPTIVGAGGKRGTIFALMAFAAFAALSGGLSIGASGSLFGGASWGATAAGTTAATAAMPGWLSNLGVNIGLAMLSSLFMTKPQQETSRQNDYFGSLTNTTASGTSIGLHYGLVRVGGQMISGYLKTYDRNQDDSVSDPKVSAILADTGEIA